MKEKTGFVNDPLIWKPPVALASINIDPTRYSHLLVYDKYCQVVVGHATSPSLNKSDAETVLSELKGLIRACGTTKSKLSAIKYTPSTIRIGPCLLLGKECYNGLIRALELYIADGPYHKDKPYIVKNAVGEQIVSKEKVGSVNLFSWWDFKRHSFGSSYQLTIVGPYEMFSFGFVDKSFIDKLSEAIKCLIESDTREVKIDTSWEWFGELNLRVFKQSICDKPAVCISTDGIMGNQRSLIFISKESGVRFLKFLDKAKQTVNK